jgi:hypothetical protein
VSQARALLFKLAVYLVIFGIILPVIGGHPLSGALILALVHTLLLWLADQFLLPRLGTTVGLVSDGLILLVGTPVVLGLIHIVPELNAWILSTLVGMIFEWFFNRWLIDHDLVL